MSRKLLVISSKPLETRVVAVLRRSDWDLQIVPNLREARRSLQDRDLFVGFFVLWPEDDTEAHREILEIVRAAPDLRWIGALDEAVIAESTYLALIAEYLHDFVTLPLDPTRLAVIAGHAYGMAELERRYQSRQRLESRSQFDLIGDSPPMVQLFQQIQMAAASDAPVVLLGETGTGKERVARAIHAASPRKPHPFLSIPCARVPPTTPRSHLGADESPLSLAQALDRAFEKKHAGGTLYLDNLSELPAGAQVRLINLIDYELWNHPQEPEDPWEGSRLRIISASDVDLSQCVQGEILRCDLFYRLHVIPIRVPSLRERGDEDIRMLAHHFLKSFQKSRSSKILGFSEDALAVLGLHDWPGNVRELRNRIYHAVLSCDEPYITPAHLELERRKGRRTRMTLQEAREAAEREVITAAVKRNKLNLTRAAEELGIARITLYRLLEQYGIGMHR